MSKLKIENVTEGTMIAHPDGFILTQVELCKKLPPIKKEFARVRKELYSLFFTKSLRKSAKNVQLSRL